VQKPVPTPERKTIGSQRHDELLLKTFVELGSGLTEVKRLIPAISLQRGEKRVKMIKEARARIGAAEQLACALFDEGAEWLRKYNALETLFGPKGNTPDMQHFATLFFAYTRYFETGLPALDSISDRIAQCESCSRATDLPRAILYSNQERLHKELAAVPAAEPN
jgi:hypothetical protein